MNLFKWHNIHGSIDWCVTPEGVHTPEGIERTKGEPATVRRIWKTYQKDISDAAYLLGVPVEIIVACIATESGGKKHSLRKEPGYVSDEETPHRISAGLMQTLLSTATDTMGVKISRQELFQPRVSILSGTMYIRKQSKYTNLDPPLVFAAYNAGGVYEQTSKKNRWKTRQYPIGTSHHVDRAIKWLNDIVSVGISDNRNWQWFCAGRTLE